MEAARRMMQIIQGAFLFSIVLYTLMTKMLPANVAPNVLIFKVLSLLAMANVVIIFLVRQKLVKSAEQTYLPSRKIRTHSDAGAPGT